MAEEAKFNFVDDPSEVINNQQEQEVQETIEEPAVEVADTEPAQTEEVDAVQQVQGETEESVLRDEGVVETSPEEIQVPQEEITEIEEIEPPVQEVEEQEIQQEPANYNLPDGIEKLVQFVQETGGTLEDYIHLNKDFSGMSDDALLMEYYAQSKPHWSAQEIKDHIEDEFTLDEEYEDGEDMSRDDKRKLRFKKEELNKAKQFLEGQKQKYYENIKMNSQQVSQQQLQEQQAEEQARIEIRNAVDAQQKELFSENFQGFDFNTGDKKFRIKENGQKLYDAQNDLSDVLMEHMNEDGSFKDVASYHKSLYAFRNPDKLFNQAYQQGKADALKERAQSSKNIDMAPKTTEANASNQNKPRFTIDAKPPGW